MDKSAKTNLAAALLYFLTTIITIRQVLLQRDVLAWVLAILSGLGALYASYRAALWLRDRRTLARIERVRFAEQDRCRLVIVGALELCQRTFTNNLQGGFSNALGLLAALEPREPPLPSENVSAIMAVRDFFQYFIEAIRGFRIPEGDAMNYQPAAHGLNELVHRVLGTNPMSVYNFLALHRRQAGQPGEWLQELADTCNAFRSAWNEKIEGQKDYAYLTPLDGRKLKPAG
jgi:hypothetical protein